MSAERDIASDAKYSSEKVFMGSFLLRGVVKRFTGLKPILHEEKTPPRLPAVLRARHVFAISYAMSSI